MLTIFISTLTHGLAAPPDIRSAPSVPTAFLGTSPAYQSQYALGSEPAMPWFTVTIALSQSEAPFHVRKARWHGCTALATET